MRIISARKIEQEVSKLAVRANIRLRKDVVRSLKLGLAREKNRKAKAALGAIIKNASIAANERLAICQDTGLPVLFLEIGQSLRINGDLKRAVNKGIESGYKKANLRNSVIRDPLSRGKPDYSPAVIHIDIVKGDKLKIALLVKGFGCENRSQIKMFNPAVSVEEIKKFIVGVVSSSGPDACPPYVVGVGIGGTADYACFLAKKALLMPAVHTGLEEELLKEINKLGIGPMGLGGKTTCLAVRIRTYPTHIAGLPVAVNISCHALRSAAITL